MKCFMFNTKKIAMKNIIYPLMLVLCVMFTHCTKEDEYKKYMDGAFIYPQKADSVKTYPGKNRIRLEWEIVDPKVAACKIYYEQAGMLDSITVPVNRATHADNSFQVVIPNLEETTYAFKIISYDNAGSASIAVEAEESSYGEVYESSLLNRAIKSALFNDDEGLLIEWYGAEATVIGINLSYTDRDGNNRTMIVDPSEMFTTIPDFEISKPLLYRTMYQPVPTAIDTFFAQVAEKQFPYEVNITHLLKNTEFPFVMGDLVSQNRYYKAVDWKYNEAGLANGNVDNQRGGTLVIIAYSAWGVGTITNGKLYQTVELEAGSYRLDVDVNETSGVMGNAYIVVASGDDLPDTDDVEQQALAFVAPPTGIATGAVRTFSLDFDLSVKSTVSMGFVVTFEPPAGTIHQIHFRKIELWEKR